VQAPTGELPKLVRTLLEPLGLTAEPPGGGAARERWESLLALVELAEELAATVADADLPRYVHELDLRAQAQHPPTVEGVTLASLHSAKGLEWDAVFLVGLVDGTLPIQHADGNEAQIEEERRLLYVGVTRAREHLSLTWALARAEGGKRYRRRSRFLYGLIPENHPTARVAASATRKRDRGMPMIRHCWVCGDELAGTMAFKLGRCETCPVDLDHGLLERLRQWRLERSKALRVPVYVIFTDATLLAIAEQRPADRAALVSISGVGAVKLDKFGQEVLAVVANATRSSSV
jgi:DNA helicase-2/ATP-dependent DNA helicase PcrA